MAKCKLVVMSDIHYSDTIDKDSEKLTEYAIPLLNTLINKVNDEIKPDAVIMLGDMIEDHDNKEQDVNNIKYVISELKKAKAPVHYLIGNHDLRPYDSIAELEKLLNLKSSTYSIDLNGYHLVMLSMDVDQSIDKSVGAIPRTNTLSTEHLEWLESDLKNTILPTIIFSHYGICSDKMSYSNGWFEKYPESAAYSNSNIIRKILTESNKVIAVFSGHKHWTKTSIENGIPYFSVGSLTEDIHLDRVPDGVYCIVEIEDKNISVLDRHIRLNNK